jgi:hypothetical protein
MKGARKIPAKRDPKARRFPDRTDEKHLAHVRRQPCLLRGKIAKVSRWRGVYPHTELVTEEYRHVCEGKVQAHHDTTKARGGHDRDTAPLCAIAHSELHRLGKRAFEELWGVSVEAAASRLAPQRNET